MRRATSCSTARSSSPHSPCPAPPSSTHSRDRAASGAAHPRARTARPRTALLAPSYRPVAAGALLGDSANASATATTLAGRGIVCAAVALPVALDAAAHAAAQVQRPELICQDPRSRDRTPATQRPATKSSSGAHGSRCGSARSPTTTVPTRSIARRADGRSPGLARAPAHQHRPATGDATPRAQHIAAFAEGLWPRDWPDLENAGAVLHAKAIIADDDIALVISAHRSRVRAQHRGCRPARDRTLAAGLSVLFKALDRRRLLPLT